jgi:hypothetical protein
MTRRVGLAHLTVLPLTPPEVVRVAARTGYDAVGLRMIAITPGSPHYPLMDDPAMLRDTLAACAQTGVAVTDIEVVKITPDLDVAALEAFVATGARLGARHIITAPYDPEPARLADTLGQLSDLAVRHGLQVVLEFFPWTVVPDLASATSLVDATGLADLCILVDTLHFARSASTLEQLAAVPASRLPFVHVCDAEAAIPTTTEGLLHTARAERLPPGEGGLPIGAVLSVLPPDIPVALEVPMLALMAEAGPEAVALRAREGLRRNFGM